MAGGSTMAPTNNMSGGNSLDASRDEMNNERQQGHNQAEQNGMAGEDDLCAEG